MLQVVRTMGMEGHKFMNFDQINERQKKAKRLVNSMKLCSEIMNDLVIDSVSILPSEDSEILKTKVGEFLGHLYLDVYRKHIVVEFPEFAGSLEAD